MFRLFQRKKPFTSKAVAAGQVSENAIDLGVSSSKAATLVPTTAVVNAEKDDYNQYVSIDTTLASIIKSDQPFKKNDQVLVAGNINDIQPSTSATAAVTEHINARRNAYEERKVNLAQTAATLAASLSEEFSNLPHEECESQSEKLFVSAIQIQNDEVLKFGRAYLEDKNVPSTAVINLNDGLASTSRNERAEWQSGSREQQIETIADLNAYTTYKQETTSSNQFNNNDLISAENAKYSAASTSNSSAGNTDTLRKGYLKVNYRNLIKTPADNSRLARLSLTLGLTKRNTQNTDTEKVKKKPTPPAEAQAPTTSDQTSHIEHLDNETLNQVKEANYTVKPAKSTGWKGKRLGNLFMARGRNQNRNKSVQQQTKLQQQQQVQQMQQHQQNQQQQQQAQQQIKQQATTTGTRVPLEFVSRSPDSQSKNTAPLMNRYDNNKNLSSKQTTNSKNTKHLERTADPASANVGARNRSQMTSHIFSTDTYRKDNAEGERTQPLTQHSQRSQRAHSADQEGALNRRARSCSTDECKTDNELYTGRRNSAKALEQRHNFFATQIQNIINLRAAEYNTASTANNNNTAAVTAREREEVRKSGNDNNQTEQNHTEFDKSAQISKNDANDKSQSEELTACEHDNLWQRSVATDVQKTDNIAATCDISRTHAPMGQANAKIHETSPSARNSATREFRESIIPTEAPDKPRIVLPTITVVDYSKHSDGAAGDCIVQPVSYDYDAERINSVKITPIEETIESILIETAKNVPTPQPTYPLHMSTRHINIKLADVPEQEEDEEINEQQREHVANGNLDNEIAPKHFDSPERNNALLKSDNASDSNLSTGCPDSGFVDNSQAAAGNDKETTAFRFVAGNAATGSSRLPFVRDGNSTDCDELLMPNEEFDYVADVDDSIDTNNIDERLVCIESISLPDVVVESTGSGVQHANANLIGASAAAAEEQIVNINGATGNSMGNVHFVPIHVEGDHPKRRSIDDSCIGSGGIKMGEKPIIEIVEDPFVNEIAAEKFKRELIAQKNILNSKLENAQKNLENLQSKSAEMQAQMEKIEAELSVKTWNVERLEAELNAAHKDDEFVRKKLKLLEDEKIILRQKCDENEDQYQQRLESLEDQYKELEAKYKQTQSLASNLQTQLAVAQSEAEDWRQEVDKIRAELEEQIKILREALDNSRIERRICEDRWQKEFENLRTQNRDREETLMEDCEWKLRQTQMKFKEKFVKSEEDRCKVLDKVQELEKELKLRNEQVDTLKTYEAEVKSLRGLVAEQEQSIHTLMGQIEGLKNELHVAKYNLEEQIEAVSKIKYQCENAIRDKERQLNYRIDEIRHEAASFWENKLYSEMTRLKNELESVYAEERRDALDRVQAEQVEELRALTTRYTANEEELRAELAETEANLARKNEEYIELREKSDNALLQTRMHLDRADREYQNAMCREEERRETLEATLRKEFKTQTEEMEKNFLERINQVQEEFAMEIQITRQELTDQHQKELDEQKARLKAEKDEALQELVDRYKKKLIAADERLKDIEQQHQMDLKELKADYDADKAALDKRDLSNANEIEQLHRKCRCLTNLFEEMRMRYERRDPRPEDLREIEELRTRCESQERDMYELTARLREAQMLNDDYQKKVGKQIKKPPPKTIATSCDVIYEENEERESPPPEQLLQTVPNTVMEDLPDLIDIDDSDLIAASKNQKAEHSDVVNEDDSHMITAV